MNTSIRVAIASVIAGGGVALVGVAGVAPLAVAVTSAPHHPAPHAVTVSKKPAVAVTCQTQWVKDRSAVDPKQKGKFKPTPGHLHPKEVAIVHEESVLTGTVENGPVYVKNIGKVTKSFTWKVKSCKGLSPVQWSTNPNAVNGKNPKEKPAPKPAAAPVKTLPAQTKPAGSYTEAEYKAATPATPEKPQPKPQPQLSTFKATCDGKGAYNLFTVRRITGDPKKEFTVSNIPDTRAGSPNSMTGTGSLSVAITHENLTWVQVGDSTVKTAVSASCPALHKEDTQPKKATDPTFGALTCENDGDHNVIGFKQLTGTPRNYEVKVAGKAVNVKNGAAGTLSTTKSGKLPVAFNVSATEKEQKEGLTPFTVYNEVKCPVIQATPKPAPVLPDWKLSCHATTDGDSIVTIKQVSKKLYWMNAEVGTGNMVATPAGVDTTVVNIHHTYGIIPVTIHVQDLNLVRGDTVACDPPVQNPTTKPNGGKGDGVLAKRDGGLKAKAMKPLYTKTINVHQQPLPSVKAKHVNKHRLAKTGTAAGGIVLLAMLIIGAGMGVVTLRRRRLLA